MSGPTLAPAAAPTLARLLTCGALLTSALAAAWLTSEYPWMWFIAWFPSVLVAIPLGIKQARAFRVTCWVVVGLLLVLAVLGLLFGLFVHLPAAVILALATAVDPQKAPRRTKAAARLGPLVAAVASVAWALAF
ncbi:hypothetical protein ACGFIE_17770 [Micromonospora sp. NPDC049275]|uniref:hypothetical protein n=1 Tax=Micromonospora sp. NPDC049275 TaxID=3364268 RepID=UPI003712A2DD